MKPIDSLTDDEFTELVQRAARLPEAPQATVQAAIGLWPEPGKGHLGSLAERAGQIIDAVLSFDSWARPALAFGMRSAGSETRQLLFSAGTRDIDLRISRVADAFAVAGQILGPDETGFIELAPDSEPPQRVSGSVPGGTGGSAPGLNSIGSRTTPVDQQGEFRLDDIQAGTYRMTLRLAGDTVVLPPIVVGDKTA